MRLASAIRQEWRVLLATPAQRVAMDAVLDGGAATRHAKPAGAGGFDEVERRFGLALVVLLNAIDAYRDLKEGGAV